MCKAELSYNLFLTWNSQLLLKFNMYFNFLLLYTGLDSVVCFYLCNLYMWKTWFPCCNEQKVTFTVFGRRAQCLNHCWTVLSFPSILFCFFHTSLRTLCLCVMELFLHIIRGTFTIDAICFFINACSSYYCASFFFFSKPFLIWWILITVLIQGLYFWQKKSLMRSNL